MPWKDRDLKYLIQGIDYWIEFSFFFNIVTGLESMFILLKIKKFLVLQKHMSWQFVRYLQYHRLFPCRCRSAPCFSSKQNFQFIFWLLHHQEEYQHFAYGKVSKRITDWYLYLYRYTSWHHAAAK